MNRGILIILILGLTPFLTGQEETGGGGGCQNNSSEESGSSASPSGGGDPGGECQTESCLGSTPCVDCIDNDGNGSIDCEDNDCSSACNNGSCSSDCDGSDSCTTVCFGPGEFTNSAIVFCRIETNCENGEDDDRDGYIDCEDRHCCIREICTGIAGC